MKNTMIKVVAVMALAFTAFSVRAASDSYLYWMVGDNVTSCGESVTWNTAKVKYGDTYLNWYLGNGESSLLKSVGQLEGGGSADLYWGTFDASSQSSFIFELYNDGDLVGERTESYATLYDRGSIWTGSNMTAAGATAYTLTNVVPEPTSGLLMLFGLAGLALRRKRRA